MKKVIALLGVLVLLVTVGIGAFWWTGQQVETRLADQYKQLATVPMVKVVKRDFHRDLLTSQDTVTVEVMGDFIRALQKLDPDKMDSAQVPAKPLEITVKTVFKHGPWVDGTLAAAVADSELVLPEDVRAELAKLFGQKPPLHVRTRFEYLGGGHSTLTSPAWTAAIPGGTAGSQQLTWDGITIDVDFTDGSSFVTHGVAPKLEVTSDKGLRTVLTGLTLEGKQQRIFNDEPWLFSGIQSMKVAEVSVEGQGIPVAGGVKIKEVVYDNIAAVDGDFLDAGVKFGIANVGLGQQNWGPVHQDVSIKHLHARTMAKLYRSLMQLYGDPERLTQADAPEKFFAPLMEDGKALLAQKPELLVDRISLNSPFGEIVATGFARLNDAAPEDFANPVQLLAKLSAGADVTAAETLFGIFGAPILDTYIKQGLVVQENGKVKAQLKFDNSQLLVNGKPFDPGVVSASADDKTSAIPPADNRDATAGAARKPHASGAGQ